jgi:hypothetical protein
MQIEPNVEATRRKFLRTAAAAASAAVAGSLIPHRAEAQDPRIVLDVAILNYLLRVEYVQAELYREGLTDFTTAARIRQFDAYGGAATLETLRGFHEQELQHAEALRALILRLGGTPLPPCTVNFARFGTATDMMQLAFALENVGVSAYLGVVPLLRFPQVQTGVTSIASVEARHSAYIGVLNGQSPAPAPADTPRSRDEVLALLDPYIGRCSTE